jgi:rare lipoprotein A
MKRVFLLISFSLLVACGGNSAIKSTTKPPAASNESVVAKSGAGGYYLDDGPGENAPANIDSIPNATLRTEQPSVRANKPYMALGRQYTPMTSYAPYKKQGIASWYGKRYHGKKTSTGEIYDMYAMSAAHTVLPIPSYAKVTNPANGRSVVVRINDRGPFKHDRLIDLSYVAAYQLRLVDQGSGLVEVEAIDTSAGAMQKNLMEQVTLPETITPVIQSPKTESISTPYYVQVGAFKNELNGNILQKKIQGQGVFGNVEVANVYNNGIYRVRLGPYASKQEAENSATEIRSRLNMTALVTN